MSAAGTVAGIALRVGRPQERIPARREMNLWRRIMDGVLAAGGNYLSFADVKESKMRNRQPLNEQPAGPVRTTREELEAAKKKARNGRLARVFELKWQSLKGPALAKEVRFHPERRWRFDYADESRMIAIELEGGIWTKGAHTRGQHYNSDCEKYNAATEAGWRVFRLTTDMVQARHLVPIITLCLAPHVVSHAGNNARSSDSASFEH